MRRISFMVDIVLNFLLTNRSPGTSPVSSPPPVLGSAKIVGMRAPPFEFSMRMAFLKLNPKSLRRGARCRIIVNSRGGGSVISRIGGNGR